MPALLGYRYQKYVFGEYTNGLNKSLVDYTDPENAIFAKVIPIMDVTNAKEVFRNSFDQTQGNLGGGAPFTYSHCIVDLDPTLSEYNDPNETNNNFKVASGDFPMSFADGVNVNVDEYKTKKLVLQRIDSISGENFDTFIVGSHSTDYDLITDPKKRKYGDSEAILDGAKDDYAEVTLGNGGSYQKKWPDTDLTNKGRTVRPDDLYDYNMEDGATDNRKVQKRNPNTGDLISGKYEAKYFRNKHFFMDPFALTIAQWCYIKLNSQSSNNASKSTARDLLEREGNLEEMERSYWKYLLVWEKNDWVEEKVKWVEWVRYHLDWDSEVEDFVDNWKLNNLDFVDDWKSKNPQADGETIAHYNDRANAAFDEATWEAAKNEARGNAFGRSDETWQQLFKDNDWYNPLEDTRPYYYATYNAIRGTGQVFTTRNPNVENYIISDSGDEFQMNTRTEPETTSFMDILNTKVVFQTQKRIYGNGNVKTVE